MKVVAVCSKDSFDLVRSFGADVVFDYVSSYLNPLGTITIVRAILLSRFRASMEINHSLLLFTARRNLRTSLAVFHSWTRTVHG